MNSILNKLEETELVEEAKKLRSIYHEGEPFPNIVVDNFFDEDFLGNVLNEFPDLSSIADFDFKNDHENKLATNGEYRLGANAKQLVRFMNSQPMLDYLSELTGIENLIPDPSLSGGGYHEIKRGGYLKIHADFNKLAKYNLDRRLNVLIYLNKDWLEDYGGYFELWDESMTKCEKKILPLFNRMAMFSTTSKSFHGHPDPLNCPENRSRKSIALYYYTNGRPEEEVVEGLEEHTTIFKTRVGIDKSKETTGVEYLNQPVVGKYSRIKKFIPPILLDMYRKLNSHS